MTTQAVAYLLQWCMSATKDAQARFVHLYEGKEGSAIGLNQIRELIKKAEDAE